MVELVDKVVVLVVLVVAEEIILQVVQAVLALVDKEIQVVLLLQ
jgi:hypothetical protein